MIIGADPQTPPGSPVRFVADCTRETYKLLLIFLGLISTLNALKGGMKLPLYQHSKRVYILHISRLISERN